MLRNQPEYRGAAQANRRKAPLVEASSVPLWGRMKDEDRSEVQDSSFILQERGYKRSSTLSGGRPNTARLPRTTMGR